MERWSNGMMVTNNKQNQSTIHFSNSPSFQFEMTAIVTLAARSAAVAA
jgi:hypothetical protein